MRPPVRTQTPNRQPGYHAPIGAAGGYDIAFNGLQTTRGLDPPNFDSPHNDASSVGQFARFTLPAGGNNFTNITFVNSHSTFQIPNDVANGEPASPTITKRKATRFWQFSIITRSGIQGSITFGPAYKASRDPGLRRSDERLDLWRGPQRRAAPLWKRRHSRRTAPTRSSRPETSARRRAGIPLRTNARRSITSCRATTCRRFGSTHVAAGGYVRSHSRVEVLRDHAAAKQLSRADPNTEHAERADDGRRQCSEPRQYLPVLPSGQLAYEQPLGSGLRTSLRFFAIKSTGFAQGFGAFSPRLKLTRFFGKRASLYAYIGRFFEPFSFENVSPEAAYLLNLPLQPTLGAV